MVQITGHADIIWQAVRRKPRQPRIKSAGKGP